MSPRAVELDLVQNELLAQYRQSRRTLGLEQVLECPVEEFGIAEHTEHARAAALVGLCAFGNAEPSG